MKRVSILIMLLVAMVAIVGCGNDKDDTNNNQVEGNNEEKEDANQSNLNQGVMELRETGLVDDELGQYEIRPNSVEIFEERDGIKPNNDDEVFVLIDYTVENIGEKAFEEEDILGIRLLLKNTQGDEFTEISYYDYEFVDNITESIEPGKAYDSQLLFGITKSESEYILHFGSHSAGMEDAEWSFTESEAK